MATTWPSANFENLGKSSRDEIIKEANFHLGQANSTTAEFKKTYHMLHAQFLVQELAARAQRQQTTIMVVCTIVITIFTVVITWATLFPSH